MMVSAPITGLPWLAPSSEAAPDDQSRARVADALASLQAVRPAMDAERAPGGAGAQQAGVARSRLAPFEASLRALREPGQQAP